MRRFGLIAPILIATTALVALLLHWHGHGYDNTVPKSSSPELPTGITEVPWRKRSPTRMARSVAEGRDARTDWRAEFASSHDYFAFVSGAAGAANHGDGAAAFYVAQALLTCALEVSMYRARQSEDSSQRVSDESWQARYPLAAESMRAQFHRHYALCKGFFHHDAFAALPPRKGGYFSFTYWMNQAYQDHDPIAEVEHVAGELPAAINPPSQLDGRAYAAARETLIHAVSTGEPEAVFRAGMLMSRAGHRADLTRGFAVALAGCELGYDCSSNNASVVGNCVRTGYCPPGEDLSDIVRKAIGEAGYAHAYALAQELIFAISRGDSATVARFVRVPPSFRCSPPDEQPVHCAPIPRPDGASASSDAP